MIWFYSIGTHRESGYLTGYVSAPTGRKAAPKAMTQALRFSPEIRDRSFIHILKPVTTKRIISLALDTIWREHPAVYSRSHDFNITDRELLRRIIKSKELSKEYLQGVTFGVIKLNA